MKLLAVVLVCLLAAPVSGQGHTRDGAVLGGVAGAIAGGIIGHQNDETPEGALIGGALGAIAGGVIGNAQDQQIARQHVYRERQWQHYRQAVGIQDVVALSRSGVSDTVIMNQIAAYGVQQRLETYDIISLHQQGVSPAVIDAMQRAAVGPSIPVVTNPPAVVVRREYHVVPRYVPPVRYSRHHHHCLPPRGYHFHWGF